MSKDNTSGNECQGEILRRWLSTGGSWLFATAVGDKEPFINYVRDPKDGGGWRLEKSPHTLTLGKGGSNPLLRNIFQVDILY